MWGVVVVTVRQRVVPARLLGRVNSVYFLFTMGGAALGALAGGVLARGLGLTAPFWIAAAANTLLILAGLAQVHTGRPRPPSSLSGSPTAAPRAMRSTGTRAQSR